MAKLRPEDRPEWPTIRRMVGKAPRRSRCPQDRSLSSHAVDGPDNEAKPVSPAVGGPGTKKPLPWERLHNRTVVLCITL